MRDEHPYLLMKTKLLLSIVKWMLAIWFPSQDMGPINSFFGRVDIWIRSRGPKWTIRRLKDLRLILWHTACDTSYSTSFLKQKDGVPSVFRHWRAEILSKDPQTYRLLNTLLNVSKVIKYWGPADYQTITNPATYQEDQVIDLADKLAKLVTVWRLPKLDTECQSFHFSGKSGPNGPALLSSMVDAVIAPEELRENVRLLGGEWLHQQMVGTSEVITPIKDQVSEFYKLRNFVVRRIAHRLDFEGKIRPIGIFDYWSQASLKGLHDELFRILRRFPQDMTFDQNRFAEGEIPKGPYYCYDLHAATDRFPILIQERVLAELIGQAKARAWREMMSNYEFLTPDGQRIKYAVGQPMGGYSSWATFTLCHHLVVQQAALDVGLGPRFGGYWLLGDDIVIRDTRVATRYLELLRVLGVEVSLEKSLVSEETFEFAKRLFIRGSEVTGLSLYALSESRGWLDLWAYLMTIKERGWVLPESTRYGLIKDLLVRKGNSRSYATRAAFRMRGLDVLRYIISDHPNTMGIPHQYLRDLGFCISCNQVNYAQEFLLECVAALKVQELQNSLISVTKEVNVFIHKLANLAAGQVNLTQESIRFLPPVGAFLEKGSILQNEGMTVESLALSQDWIGLLRSGIVLIPDPRRVITRMSSTDRLRSSKSLIIKLTHLVRDEINMRDEELRS